MKINKLFNSIVMSVALMSGSAVMASPCDNSLIEIYNQTESPLMVINREAMGNTIIENIGENDIIPADGKRVVKVHSGSGTYGNARGVITLVNHDDHGANSEHKFVALRFDFNNQLGLSCSREAEVINANSKEYSTYLVDGYSDNVKLFIVGK